MWHYTQRRLKSVIFFIHFKIVLLSPVYGLRVQVAALGVEKAVLYWTKWGLFSRTLFPATQGPSILKEKRISNNRLVVQGTTQNTLPVWKITGLFWTLNSSAAEKVSPPPQILWTNTLFFLFFSFIMSVTELLMCWRWLDIFLIKIYVLNIYQVTKLPKYKEGGFSWLWANHSQRNLLGSLNTGESQHHFDLKAD